MAMNSQSVIVHPVSSIHGTFEVPGDKSISHRVAMLSALAAGTSRIIGFLHSEDCLNTLRAMEAVGARVTFAEDGLVTVRGTGGKLLQPAGQLDMGNSGTGIRLLTGLLAGHPLTVELSGDASLRSRPMRRIQDPLQKMGATIELLGPNGCAPVRVRGGNLKAIDYTIPVASAQVKSCILLAGLYATGKTVITEPGHTRDHTERIFKTLGFPLTVKGLHMELEGYGPKGPQIAARDWSVPGDFSSAAFLIVAAATRSGSEITVRNVGLNPRRIALLEVLDAMGAGITVSLHRDIGEGEPIGDVTVRGGELTGTRIAGSLIPVVIDELPAIAVAAALAHGETVIADAKELRVKESDRIAVMVENLRNAGVNVEERPDGMVIHGPSRIVGKARLNSFNDHRVAMAMAILALSAAEPLCICNVACTNTSYPTFWDDLRKMGAHVE